VRPLAIVRPEPGAAATLAAARHLGLDAHAFPLFAVRPVAWEAVSPSTIDAVLIGSANALRHGGAGLEALRGLPAYCVGQATARAAGEAGLDVVRVGSGGLQAVTERLDPAHRRLLRLAGTTHVPLTTPAGHSVETRIVYESVALPLPQALAALLRRPAVVMLHSGEAAAHLAATMHEAGLDRGAVGLACIGARVAAMAGAGWASIRSAPLPNDSALLALAGEMCQDAARGAENP